MDTRPVDGIIFDLDGVLADSEALIAEAENEMFRTRYGIEFTDEEFQRFVGVGEDNFLLAIGEIYGLDVVLPDDKLRAYEIYLQNIKGRLQPVPGAKEFVGICRDRDIRMAVASSGDRMKVDGNLTELNFPDGTFQAVLTGDDAEKMKPDPEIFLKAAAALELDPSSCVVLEDALNGIIAGKAAGARCVGIATSFPADKLIEAGADWTAPDLRGLEGLLF